jgi:RmlD substrate binding domain
MQADAQPDILINAAAYPWVYGAESEPDGALVVDRDGAGHIAAAWRDVGMPLIQYLRCLWLRRHGVSSARGRGAHRSSQDVWPQPVRRGETVRSCHWEQVTSCARPNCMGVIGRTLLRGCSVCRGSGKCFEWWTTSVAAQSRSRQLAEVLATICQRLMQGRTLNLGALISFAVLDRPPGTVLSRPALKRSRRSSLSGGQRSCRFPRGSTTPPDDAQLTRS